MDFSSMFQCVIDQMDAEDMLDTAHAIHNEVLATLPSFPPPYHPFFNPPPTPSPPPPPPAPHTVPHVDYGSDVHPQPTESPIKSYDGYIILEAVPLSFEQSLTSDQTMTVEQSTATNYFLDDISMDTSSPQQDHVPAMTPPQGPSHNLTPTEIKQEESCEISEVENLIPPIESDSPQNVSSQECNDGRQGQRHPYVKKPPNAFMLYMKEQRAAIVAELGSNNNAMVNTVLGQRWRSLSEDEQIMYSQKADKLRKLHAEKYPWWSSRDNYGKKRKRIRRRKYPLRSDDSPSPPFIEESPSPPNTPRS